MGYLGRYAIQSPDVSIVVGEDEAKLMKEEKNQVYVVAYLAGCVKYAFENREKGFTPQMYASATVSVLNFYIKNRDLTGKVKYLEKYVDTFNKKGPDALEQQINKNYPKAGKK